MKLALKASRIAKTFSFKEFLLSQTAFDRFSIKTSVTRRVVYSSPTSRFWIQEHGIELWDSLRYELTNTRSRKFPVNSYRKLYIRQRAS